MLIQCSMTHNFVLWFQPHLPETIIFHTLRLGSIEKYIMMTAPIKKAIKNVFSPLCADRLLPFPDAASFSIIVLPSFWLEVILISDSPLEGTLNGLYFTSTAAEVSFLDEAWDGALIGIFFVKAYSVAPIFPRPALLLFSDSSVLDVAFGLFPALISLLGIEGASDPFREGSLSFFESETSVGFCSFSEGCWERIDSEGFLVSFRLPSWGDVLRIWEVPLGLSFLSRKGDFKFLSSL